MSIMQDIERDIELAKLMASDIDKVYKKYAKAALLAEQARAEKVRAEKYHDCTSVAELQNSYGYGEITLEEYDAGRDFFEAQEARGKQLSLVEHHRKNLREIRDRWRGTAIELQRELDEMNGVVKDERTYVEKLEAEECAERYAQMT
jgi:hypothetical protein